MDYVHPMGTVSAESCSCTNPVVVDIPIPIKQLHIACVQEDGCQ